MTPRRSTAPSTRSPGNAPTSPTRAPPCAPCARTSSRSTSVTSPRTGSTPRSWPARSTTASRRWPTSATPRCSSAASTTCTRPAPTGRRAREGRAASTSGAGTCTTHDGDPMVIDWRAPVSQPFYRASKKDPLDVALRRRFGYTGGDLTAYEDEHLSDPAEVGRHQQAAPAGDRAPARRPDARHRRDHPARAGRDRTQSGLGGTVCVQGGPGTGKTAVGLHRVAYLLYAHRERLARTGTLVIGPNRSFLHYIEQVLPALGELAVKQATVDDLVAHVEVRGADEAAGRGHQGRREDGGGAAAGRPLARHPAHRAGRRRARLTPLAGPGVRTRGHRPRVARPRHPLRRRPRGPPAAHRACRAGADGAVGRGAGRPGAGRGGPQQRR